MELDYENAPLEPPTNEDDQGLNELGLPESIDIDVNAVIHALQREWANEVAQLQWDKANHLAAKQEMQQRWQRAEAMKASLEEALAAEIAHSRDVEERLDKALALLDRGVMLMPDQSPEAQPEAPSAAPESSSTVRDGSGPAESPSPKASAPSP
jgi:hypothetical protein